LSSEDLVQRILALTVTVTVTATATANYCGSLQEQTSVLSIFALLLSDARAGISIDMAGCTTAIFSIPKIQ
jgi:hypothetical protein